MESGSEASAGDVQYLFQHIGNKGIQAGDEQRLETIHWIAVTCKATAKITHDRKVSDPKLRYLSPEAYDIRAGSIVGTFASTPVLAFLHKRRGGLLDSEFTPRAMKAISLTTLAVTTISCTSISIWKEI